MTEPCESNRCPTALVTYSGRTIDMLAPQASDIAIEDIARSLSAQCRFNGHLVHARFYSVAEHSAHVSELLRKWGHSVQVQREGLLHDAAEAYIGDMIGPMKVAMRSLAYDGSDFDLLEERWLTAIGSRFDVSINPMSVDVKRADVAQFHEEDFALRGTPPPTDVSVGRSVCCYGPADSERMFLACAKRLGIV